MSYQSYIANAVKWAREQMGSADYRFRCLAFVEDAYEKANGVEIFGESTAKESAEAFGVKADLAIPPAGAFVFYDCSGPIDEIEKNWGHVGCHVAADVLSMHGIACARMII